MATTNHAAIQIERAHNRALEVVREHGGGANAERVEYLDNLGGMLSSVNYPAQLSSAQSVLIGALAEIVEEQDRRITELDGRIAELENPTPAATSPPNGGRKSS